MEVENAGEVVSVPNPPADSRVIKWWGKETAEPPRLDGVGVAHLQGSLL